METNHTAENEALACQCGHGLIWHDPRQGCGYLGFSDAHRCSCLLPFHEAVREALAQAWDQGRSARPWHDFQGTTGLSVERPPTNPYRPSRPAGGEGRG